MTRANRLIGMVAVVCWGFVGISVVRGLVLRREINKAEKELVLVQKQRVCMDSLSIFGHFEVEADSLGFLFKDEAAHFDKVAAYVTTSPCVETLRSVKYNSVDELLDDAFFYIKSGTLRQHHEQPPRSAGVFLFPIRFVTFCLSQYLFAQTGRLRSNFDILIIFHNFHGFLNVELIRRNEENTFVRS